MARSSSFLTGGYYASKSFQERDCLSCRSCPCPSLPTFAGSPEGQGKQPYTSGCVQRYCDILDAGVEGNPEMLQDIIKDMQCVCDKIFGNSKSLEGRNKSLLNQIAALKDQVAKLEECKQMLQKELCRIQGELIMAQKAYEGEADQRACLEELISQLRQRLTRLEAAAEIDAKEKLELVGCIQELERNLVAALQQIESLRQENLALQAKLRELEDWRSRHGQTFRENKSRCGDLEDALAKCCKANEELQRELAELRKERDALKQCVEKLKSDMKHLCEEMDRERKEWAKERAAYEKTIAELKKALDAQTLKNREMCAKLDKCVTEHHKALEEYKASVRKYCDLYHEEKSAREELERKLRDCEERQLSAGFSYGRRSETSYSCDNLSSGCRPCETNNFSCS